MGSITLAPLALGARVGEAQPAGTEHHGGAAGARRAARIMAWASWPVPLSPCPTLPRQRQEEDGHAPFCWGQRLRAAFLISAGF